MLPTPAYFHPDQLSELYLERAGLVASTARTYAAVHKIQPAAEDRRRVAAFGIDCQVGFCHPAASLYVPGSVEDMGRAVRWIYRNLDQITDLHFSLDTHHIYQIFHPSWWVDAAGNHPEPFTAIHHEEVRDRRWRPVRDMEASLEYCQKLEANGKYVLTIWPYHTLLGGVSHALMPAVMEAAIFHGIARARPTRFAMKGSQPLTESYSVLSPEVQELGKVRVGRFDEELFGALMDNDRIYVFGEAKSHCVLATLQDLSRRIQSVDPALASKVWILEDAMSPVTPPPLDPLPASLNFPEVARAGMAALQQAGMRVVKTSDPIA
jgi:nicotinamidase-related amidase